MVSIPKHTDVTVDTIRGFYNTYLSHKYLIDHLVKLGAVKLVIKNWVYQSRAIKLHNKLVELQNVLNYNVKKLAQLVRQHVVVI